MVDDVMIYNSIRNSQLGAKLDAKELELIISYNQVLKFSSGDLVLQQGKESPGIFIIIQGNAKETAKILGESTTEIESLEPGDSFGESSFIEKIPCTTSIFAMTDTICLLLTKTYLDVITENFPETKYKLFNAISMQVCKHLKILHDKITGYISDTDMSTQSLFMEIIHSLTTPAVTTFKEQNIDLPLLRSHPFFAQFNEQEFQQILAHSKLIRCVKQCTLIHKEETSAFCYILIQGAVLSGIMHELKFAKLSVIGPITLFANAACLQKAPQFNVTFSTCEQAILLKITEQDLRYFQTEQPLLYYKLFNLICRSLIELEKSVNKLDIRLNIEKYNR